MGEAPPDRGGRLLLVEYVDSDGGPVTMFAWYRSITEGSHVKIELTPPGGTGSTVRLAPEYEDDVAVHAEAIGRGT